MPTLGITVNTGTEMSQLIAGPVHIMRRITLKASCGELSRGTILEMVSADSGTWQPLQADQPANARAILAEDVMDGETTQTAMAYTLGLFRDVDLFWPDGITTTNQRTALQTMEDRGMSVDQEWLAIPTSSTTTTTTSGG
ncbi:MAG: head decoration protein [Proteobacteria bacterium]|nr:head decoration protein [Pseudomonadota bacterium]